MKVTKTGAKRGISVTSIHPESREKVTFVLGGPGSCGTLT